MSDRVQLLVAGRVFDAWTSVEVLRSTENACSAFALEVSAAGGPTGQPVVGLTVGAPCVLMLGKDTVCTGYVDEVNPSYDKDSRTLQVQGSSRTQDVVDCSAQHPSGSWTMRTPEQIATELCSPFGVAVSLGPGVVTQPVQRWRLESGEKVYDALDRLARLQGLLITDDPLGNLVLTRVGAGKASGALVLGQNVLKAEGRNSGREVYSAYTCRGQKAGTDLDSGLAVSAAFGSATDPDVARFRPLTINAEGQAGAPQCTARAAWEASTRIGRSMGAVYTVAGWRQLDGRLYAPNELVTVQDAWLGLAGELLITGVAFTLNTSEFRSRLTVAPAAGYSPLVLPAPRAAGGRNWNPGSAWAPIAKGV